MKLTKRILALALAAPLFLVTACGGDDTPEQTPSPESSSSASETPKSGESPAKNESSPATAKEYKPATLEHPAQNVPVPKYPEAGKKDNKEGREAAVNYFIDGLLYAKQTGKSTVLDEVSYPDCHECWMYQSNAEKFYESGGWVISGPDISRKFQEQPEADEKGQYRINYVTVEHENTVVYPKETGREPQIDKSSEAKGTIWVQYWPEKKRNVVMKFQSYSIEEVE
ncbi:DUF6318 family protein [Micrococcoides hystricis]|uniref:DUF6318 family protein n=1 Tax=Micrococcoides hystricis TaxID=1572761 RepID=A0ABV6PAE5_9MICC